MHKLLLIRHAMPRTPVNLPVRNLRFALIMPHGSARAMLRLLHRPCLLMFALRMLLPVHLHLARLNSHAGSYPRRVAAQATNQLPCKALLRTQHPCSSQDHLAVQLVCNCQDRLTARRRFKRL